MFQKAHRPQNKENKMIEPIDVDDPQVEEMGLLEEKEILKSKWKLTISDLNISK